MAEGQNSNGTSGEGRLLSFEDLADKTRFKFRETVLDVPELDGELILRSLTVRERESLPDPEDLEELNDRGDRTEAAIKSAAFVFSAIIAKPKMTPEQAASVIGAWPVEAFDAITAAYRLMVANPEETRAAGAAFPAG